MGERIFRSRFGKESLAGVESAFLRENVGFENLWGVRSVGDGRKEGRLSTFFQYL
jgi:hypothetical protein